MINWNIEEQVKAYELLLSAMNSDNTDYIQGKLQEIYKMICDNNIGNI